MNTLKAKLTIYCNTCGCEMKRTKLIQVNAQDKESAMAEAREKVQKWQKTFEGKNCKTCTTILKAVANG